MGKNSACASSAGSSFASSLSHNSAITKLRKYELKRKFYEKLDDFKQRVLLYREPGFVVYRAKCAYSGAVVVLKGYSREALTMQTRQRIWSEVNILQSSQCPFILKCFDSFEDQGWWFLVLENCAAGDLYRVVQSEGRITSEGWLVSQVLLPLIQTLAYLHNEGIIHRDVKPEHVLFNSEKVVKLSGFFLAQDVTKFGEPKDIVGTLDYVAPEVFRLSTPEFKAQAAAGLVPGTYDFKVDIWMIGVLTYDVLVGVPPFASEEPNTTVQKVMLEDPVFPDEISDMAADFILCCLTKEPIERPTARQLLSHPWVRNYLAWVPPPDFEDPVPDMDWTYYTPDKRLLGVNLENQDGNEDEEDEGSRRVWYNPATWFRGNQQQQELDQDLSGLDEDGLKGPQPNRVGSNTATKQGIFSRAQRFLDNLEPGASSRPGVAGGGNNGGAPAQRQPSMSRQPIHVSSMRSARVAPSAPSLKKGLASVEEGKVGAEEEEGGPGSGTLVLGSPVGHQGGSTLAVGVDYGPASSCKSSMYPEEGEVGTTPRSDRISDDGEVAAPVMLRIQEARDGTESGTPLSPTANSLVHRPVQRAATTHAVPPVSVNHVGLTPRRAVPGTSQAAGAGTGMSSPLESGSGHALPSPVTPTMHSEDRLTAGSASRGGTPRSGAGQSALGGPHAARPGGYSGSGRGGMPVPPLALSRLQRSTSQDTSHNMQTDDVLKLSGRGALLPAPPPHPAQPSARPLDSDRSAARGLEALAPPSLSATPPSSQPQQQQGRGGALKPVPPALLVPPKAALAAESPQPALAAAPLRVPAAVPAPEGKDVAVGTGPTHQSILWEQATVGGLSP